MEMTVEKIPGGISVDGLPLKNGMRVHDGAPLLLQLVKGKAEGKFFYLHSEAFRS